MSLSQPFLPFGENCGLPRTRTRGSANFALAPSNMFFACADCRDHLEYASGMLKCLTSFQSDASDSAKTTIDFIASQSDQQLKTKCEAAKYVLSIFHLELKFGQSCNSQSCDPKYHETRHFGKRAHLRA